MKFVNLIIAAALVFIIFYVGGASEPIEVSELEAFLTEPVEVKVWHWLVTWLLIILSNENDSGK